MKVEGRDEVAALAQSFNRSAERIEELVAAHRLLLANCSHELRTPLARIAMAASLLGEDADAKTRESLKRDVDELDQLIEEILLASRLEAVPTLERHEPVDLLALAAEEAARYDIERDRPAGHRLGRPPAAAPADPQPSRERPALCRRRSDRGVGHRRGRPRRPGSPRPWAGRAGSERERIFEPFYRLAGGAETGRGSGLGLALVRDIARRHGGDAVCLAAEGGGSRFRIDLPAA